MSCGIGHRGSSNLALLWLWCRPATTALIQPLAWEPPCAMRVALKKNNQTQNGEILTVVQWVENLTAVAWVSSEAQV